MKNIPQVAVNESLNFERIEIDKDAYLVGNNRFQKNPFGIWELYLEGSPYERGIANGKLAEEYIYNQEKVFVDRVKELVPSKFQQGLVRGFLRFFNRKLDKHVTDEYKEEIFGISQYTSKEFEFVAPNYWRTLYFHAAHDIGHALQDLAMVGCTSFAAWGNQSADGKLILGRNFDFYVSDEFAENKIIAFINPTDGHKHAILTWPGMIGVVSGMNEKGLTITINAGKSSIPLVAKTPISILAREILQYASNFEQAIEIAKKREVFVAESIMVGSAEDGSAILIEVSPKKMDVFQVENSAELLVCSNHFQSNLYETDKRNLNAIQNSHSQYRFDRMNELVEKNPPITPELAAEFLRNQNGLKDQNIGMGNEKSINQLLSHHGVIFQPEDRLMWVSANPFQLGAFVAYDLDEVFQKMENSTKPLTLYVDSLTIAEDPFVHSLELKNYEEFKKKLQYIQEKINTKEKIEASDLIHFIELNPEFWKAHFMVGEYYFVQKEYENALIHYRNALEKEITTVPDREFLLKRIQKSERKLN
ncbi:C45 family peptidase [Moheibacter stercoris]|uniref:Choloylglycine hydrolase n=1 Tax=Moheibacter stercoris TaxID=1628251 RepID=A0ABV2LV50_9FLAO